MKVLVVDDDRRMVVTICGILNYKGYDYVAAYSGEEAVEKVRTESPDCVLMDIKMPGIDGVEALRRIKEVSPGLPIVLMSAYADEHRVLDGKRLGAYAVMNKPLDLQVILSFLSLLKKEESILIVDDDPNFCKTLNGILQMRGYDVKTEADPEKVMDDMDQKYRLAVLLDLKLGGKNGLDVLKAIREKYHSKPVILITAYRAEMTASIEKGMDIGAYTCLYKPLDIAALENLLKDIRQDRIKHTLEKDDSKQDR